MRNALTSLPDRGHLLQILEHSLYAADPDELVGVIVLKIHRLKDMCIEFGYGESDAVMCQIVERLHGCLRKKDHLSRISGDEFALVLPGLKNQAQPIMAINKIQRSFASPIVSNALSIKIKLTFGLGIGPNDAAQADALLRCADIALRDANANELESVRYAESETAQPAPVLQLEKELESAISEGALQSYYQPIIDVETGEFTGVEMLSRWPDGPSGEVHPSIFVNTAERSGLIMPLTLWCLNNGLRECGDWQLVLPNVPVSINFSTLVLTDPHLPEVVLSALNLWDAEVGRLTIEVTESAIMSDPEMCLAILNKLHAHGVKIAIDDFGTGYSSLTYLKDLPVDILKIDKSFVTNLVGNLANRRIVQTVIDLAHNFDLTVVAEGVEDEETLDTLTLMGCQRAQGFHVGRPMPSSNLEAWFRASPWELMDAQQVHC